MEILKLLLNNSDAIFISIIGAFIYDKIKITLTCIIGYVVPVTK